MLSKIVPYIESLPTSKVSRLSENRTRTHDFHLMRLGVLRAPCVDRLGKDLAPLGLVCQHADAAATIDRINT
jgi:hypothetical protein